MTISRRGILTGGGVPCSLASGIAVAVGQQATFTGFKKLAKRTTTQGECDLCGAGERALGVFVDCSPKGDSGTVETQGFEQVSVADSSGMTVGDVLTTAAGGTLAACTTPNTPTAGELAAGCWEIDEIIDATTVLIQIDARL